MRSLEAFKKEIKNILSIDLEEVFSSPDAHGRHRNLGRGCVLVNIKLVTEIRELAYSGKYKTALSMALRFDVSESTIRSIVTGRIFAHLDHDPKFKFLNAKVKMTREQVSEVKDRWANRKNVPITQTVMCKEYGVSQAYLSNVIRGRYLK
jgi:hypothetical protein